MLSTLANYQLIARNITASLQRVAEKPQVHREAEHYLARIEKIDTIEQFLADDRVYRFAMEACGLKDMIYAKAFMRKVLKEGVDSPESFANQLADNRFRDFARRFNFKSFGASATTFERTRSEVVNDYIRLKLEEEAGESNEGVRLALYFQRKAPGLRNGYDILADKALMKVAETILGHSLVHGDIDRNARIVEKRLKITELSDPGKLTRFLARFATMWEMNAAPSGIPNGNGAANALMTGSFGGGISQDILQTLQGLKIGGI